MSELTHGHAGSYSDDCLLCCPPEKDPESVYLAAIATSIIVVVLSGVFSALSAAHAHYDAFIIGVQFAIMVIAGLIGGVSSIAVAFLFVTIVMGTFAAGVQRLARFVKYIALRLRYGR